MFTDETQQGTDWTDGVAIDPAVTPGHDADDGQGDQCDESRAEAKQVNPYFVESKVAGRNQQRSQQVIPG
ncbi:hypothetical protein SDC9_45026 [bioreactor metagenome]|uniref:Uncharacterized protein n=1 Tax=bioreactor metagenome TaxID=1076179 RepID=A0A644W5N2_9ZZZZ